MVLQAVKIAKRIRKAFGTAEWSTQVYCRTAKEGMPSTKSLSILISNHLRSRIPPSQNEARQKTKQRSCSRKAAAATALAVDSGPKDLEPSIPNSRRRKTSLVKKDSCAPLLTWNIFEISEPIFDRTSTAHEP
jgi:hypothetical protein